MGLFVGLIGVWIQTNTSHLGFQTEKLIIQIGIHMHDKEFTF